MSELRPERERVDDTGHAPGLLVRTSARLRLALLGSLPPLPGGNDGLDAAKLIAIVLMVASHTLSALPEPWRTTGYLIGRPCVPVFVFLIVTRLAHGGPERSARMFTRLLLWGIATQPIYYALLGALTPRMNVLLTLAIGVALIHSVRTARYWLVALIVIVLPFRLDLLDGATTPFAMLAGTLVFRESRAAALAVVVLAAAAENLLSPPLDWGAAAVALAAAPIVLLSPRLASYVPRLPGILFYAVYPLHLLVIWMAFGPYR